MPSSRDSSIWKSLVVAFGDGLLFAAGMALAQGVARRPKPAPPLPFDRTALKAVIAELEASTALELKAANKQHEASRELLAAIGQTCLDASARGAGTPACRVETRLDPCPPAPG